MLVGTPIAFCLGISSFATVAYLGLPPLVVFQRLASGVSVFTLMAIPFFILAGTFLTGFVLLSATLLAGMLFGDPVTGRAGLKWDHKTVFSVLAWITFAVLLVGRSRFGWRGRKARRVLYAGTGLLLLAYVGSRFVLEVLLTHPTR